VTSGDKKPNVSFFKKPVLARTIRFVAFAKNGVR